MNFLSVIWDVNPELFHIGPLSIRWYSLMFVIGFAIGYRLFTGYLKREHLPVSLLDPLLTTMVIATFIGARLGHVLFYEPEYYFANPSEILKVWHGGLASHGGAVGILIALWWFVKKYGRKYGFDYMWILDRITITIALCGMFIRLGNLINSEIYGGPTDLPWGFIFVRDGQTVPKHPTQIYEALAYLVIFIIMQWMYVRKADKLKKGFLFGFFLTALFGVRLLVEFIKEPQVEFETDMILNMGQILSIPFIIAGIVIMIMSAKKGKPMLLEPVQGKKIRQ